VTVKKYEFVEGDTKVVAGRTLHRIRALVAIASMGVAAGDLGGYIESERNLSQVSGNAWVSGNARVYGDAQVSGNAWVSPIHFIGLPYSVTIIDKHMQIGCEFHEITEWVDFDERRIAAMDGVRSSRFWRDHGAMLIGLCRTMRPGAFSPSSAQEVR